MISWLGAAFLVFGFVVLIRLFKLVEKSGDVVTVARRSFGVIRSSALSDESKEVALQKDAKHLLRLFVWLTFGGATAVLLPTGVLWVCDRLGWVSLESIFSIAISPVFLITSGALAILAFFIPRSKRPGKTDYSALDRCLHRVAFKTYAAQVSLADLEDRLFARQLAAFKADRPVFITSLPRAGTTLLLKCCAKMQEFASHCYRDMPFVLIPCLWNRFSAMFQQAGRLRERAHGDGMLIDFDSPEALEEILWKEFWQQHYQSDRIIPWQGGDDDEFAEFFSNHMRKIILLRGGHGQDAYTARYVSKNNLNIARVRILRQLFPYSVIVVPFREPLHHAASLLEQHRNFLRIHEEDPFAYEYMRAIGHFDFGQNLRPIDFDNWLDNRTSKGAEELVFWLEYWVASYRHLLQANADILHFLDYQGLCENPEYGLQVLADAIGTRHPKKLLMAATTIRHMRLRDVDTSTVPLTLLHEADNLHVELKKIALN